MVELEDTNLWSDHCLHILLNAWYYSTTYKLPLIIMYVKSLHITQSGGDVSIYSLSTNSLFASRKRLN